MPDALELDPGGEPTLGLGGGRFPAEPSVEMDRLTRSLPVDHRLWREDVAGSQAWASAIAAAGGVTHAQWLGPHARPGPGAPRLGGGGGGGGGGGPPGGNPPPGGGGVFQGGGGGGGEA